MYRAKPNESRLSGFRAGYFVAFVSFLVLGVTDLVGLFGMGSPSTGTPGPVAFVVVVASTAGLYVGVGTMAASEVRYYLGRRSGDEGGNGDSEDGWTRTSFFLTTFLVFALVLDFVLIFVPEDTALSSVGLSGSGGVVFEAIPLVLLIGFVYMVAVYVARRSSKTG